jgi:drug/metabolite transporter (DMT)-like permease
MGRTILILTLGILCLSTASILIKYCDDVPAVTIAAWRMILAAACMLGIARARGVKFAAIDKRAWAGILLGSFFLSAHFSLWVTSLKYTSVASSVVLVTTNPIFVGLFSWLLFKERHSYELVLGIVLSFAGSAVLALGDAGIGTLAQGGEKAALGDLLALLGAVMASGYLLVGSRLRERVDLWAYTSLLYTFCAAELTILALAAGLPFTGFKTSSWWALAAMAVLPQVIGHTTINWALKHLKAGLVAITILGEPIGASFLAYFLLNEKIGPWQGLGMILIFAAILIASRKGRKEHVSG